MLYHEQPCAKVLYQILLVDKIMKDYEKEKEWRRAKEWPGKQKFFLLLGGALVLLVIMILLRIFGIIERFPLKYEWLEVVFES